MYGQNNKPRKHRDVGHIYCLLKGKPCRFVSLYAKGEKHCGIKTGTRFDNMIGNMTECPWDGVIKRGRDCK